MRKNSKIHLCRETLRNLEAPALTGVAAGVSVTVCTTCCTHPLCPSYPPGCSQKIVCQ